MIGRVSTLLRKQVPDVEAEGLLFASGSGAPTNSEAGFQTGCIYQRVDGGANTAFYINEGNAASSTWVVVGTLTSAQQEFLTGITAGTVTASKAVVVDSNKDAKSFRDIAVRNITEAQGDPAAIADGDTEITAANLQAKILTMASTTAGRAPTVPSGTDVNGIVDIGNCIDWSFINTGNQTVTISEATAHTLVGGMALTAGTQGLFRTRVSEANTAITYRLA